MQLQLNFSDAGLVSNNKPHDNLKIVFNNETNFQSTDLIATTQTSVATLLPK
jgi:hypothetical protein